MNEEKLPDADGIADWTQHEYYWLRYCFGRPPLLLTEEQVHAYVKMMHAVNQGSPYELKRAF